MLTSQNKCHNAPEPFQVQLHKDVPMATKKVVVHNLLHSVFSFQGKGLFRPVHRPFPERPDNRNRRLQFLK